MISIKITGLTKTIDKLKSLGIQGVEAIEDATVNTANEMVLEAKRSLTVVGAVDNGGLRQSIVNTQIDSLNYKVEALKFYAPYVEFGTGTMVDIKPGWEKMAGQFKGKKIKQVNLPARPFMFPAYLKGKSEYKIKLQDELAEIIKK